MTPARMREAERVELVYNYALNKLGNAMAVDALALYQRNVPADSRAVSNTSWLVSLLRMLFGFRSPAQKLAVAYYRLQRALLTGFTVSLDGETAGDTTTLDRLRDDFEAAVDTIERDTDDVPGPPLNLPDSGGLEPEDADIEFEEVTDVQALIDRLDREAEQEALDQLDQLGIANLTKNIGKVSDADENRDGKLAKVYDIASARQAAAAMRIAMNAARGLTYNLGDTDLRILGWVRMSTSGDPCAFCAMLISRGKILYATRKNAQHQGANQDEDKFHDNCRCVAVPLFLESQYDSPLYDQNRHYDELWQTYIAKKYSGNDALNKWRWYLKHGFPNGESVSVGVA
jgi:hypothetical protein